MSPCLPDRDVTIVGVERWAGAEPRRSAALAHRSMRRPTKPLPLFDRARFSALGLQASSAKPPGSVISIWQRSDILIGRLHGRLFAEILSLIARLRAPPVPA